METPTGSPQKSPGLATMLLIGCGWFGMNAFFSFNLASIPLFFNGLIEQKWVVGVILGMMGAFGIILSPVVGMRSDKIRHRLGRRRPLMIVALPFMVLVLATTQHLTIVWLMALAWPLAYFFHLIIERPWSALIPDLFPPNQRASANGVVQLMGGLGALLYFLLGAYLWARNEEVTFYLVAAVYAVGVLVIIFGIKERPTHLDEPKKGSGGSLLDYVKELREHKALLRYIIASLFWSIGLNGVLPWLTSFGTEEMGMSVELSFMPLALSVGVLILFAVPAGMLADRIGHKKVTSVGLAIFVVINICIVFVHSIPLVFVLMGIVAFGFCIIMVVPYAIVVNLIPSNRMAELIGIASIPIYLSILVAPVIAGLLVDLFGSYRPIFVLAAVCHAIGLLLLQGVEEKKVVSEA
jgi:MFS family permease